jgi:predicted RNA methylase
MPLARILTDQIIRQEDIAVLDPACGNGALLWAAAATCHELSGATRGKLSLYGCDKFKPEALSQQGVRMNFTKSDFFKYRPEKKFDLILMNPPFVASRRMAKTTRSRLHKKFSRAYDLSSTSDMWVYFLIKSAEHLSKGGSIAAILPWSFLQADYACNVRKWVSDHFGLVRTLVLRGDRFVNTKKRVLMLWLEKYGEAAESIKIGFSDANDQEYKFSKVSVAEWTSCQPILHGGNGVDKILASFVTDYGFCKFDSVADVRIGVVTGADKFFIMSPDEARAKGFDPKDLVSILTSSRELSGLAMKGSQAEKVLLKIPQPASTTYARYIRSGKKAGFDQRSHSKRRDPWYAVPAGEIPDAFFHYRVMNVPFLVKNQGKLQCTNSIHRVYFNGLTSDERKWMQISLLAVPGQLSLERFSKTYGNGMLKIEPKSLKRALVYHNKTKMPQGSYRRVSRLIAQRKKQEAVLIATKIIAEAANIPGELIKKSTEALRNLESRRLS